MGGMASNSPIRKKRKVYSNADLKVLRDAEKSDNSLCLADDIQEKELWFFQLPKDVRFIQTLNEPMTLLGAI